MAEISNGCIPHPHLVSHLISIRQLTAKRIQIPENLIIGHFSWNSTSYGYIQGRNGRSGIQAADHKIRTKKLRYNSLWQLSIIFQRDDSERLSKLLFLKTGNRLSNRPRPGLTVWSKSNYYSLNNCHFVTEAILELIRDTRISEVNSSDLHNINPLSVSSQPSGNKRLILDLRLIYHHLFKFIIKYEDNRKRLWNIFLTTVTRSSLI